MSTQTTPYIARLKQQQLDNGLESRTDITQAINYLEQQHVHKTELDSFNASRASALIS